MQYLFLLFSVLTVLFIYIEEKLKTLLFTYDSVHNPERFPEYKRLKVYYNISCIGIMIFISCLAFSFVQLLNSVY